MKSRPPLSPEVIRAMRAAMKGPEEETKVACPVCEGCPECSDLRVVTPTRRSELRARKDPK